MKKNPRIAAMLSFFGPGLGQIYNGQIAKGIGIMLALAMVAIITIPLFSYTSLWIFALLHDPNKIPGAMWIWIMLTIGLAALFFIVWFSQIVSAYKRATKINKSTVIHKSPRKRESSDLVRRVEKAQGIRRDFKRWYER